jgi:hypothetical protein
MIFQELLSQRISDELKYLGFLVSKKSHLKILKKNGFVPPKKKFDPPMWRALWDSYRRILGVYLISVFNITGRPLFIFNLAY